MMVSKGYNVLRPTSMASVYDRVVEIDGRMIKFQIKSVNTDVSGDTWMKVKTTKRGDCKYSESDVDYIAVYFQVFNDWYFQKNRGKSIVFVSFRNLNNFASCLGLKS